MNRIVECVPNFSEGRRPEVVDAIIKAITSVSNVYLLDREMDADHNRAVITVVGAPEAIGQAAILGVEAAMSYIDLTKHTGAHPRIGATDVIPFVPIRGVTLDECVQIAKNVGREIAGQFKIPVYLYEAAATRPDRTNLETSAAASSKVCATRSRAIRTASRTLAKRAFIRLQAPPLSARENR